MKPYYSENGIEIYHGDCRELMPTLADKSIGAVISDPPFETEAHTLQRRKLGDNTVGGKREIVSAPLEFAQIDEETRVFFGKEAARVSCGWVLVFCQAEAVSLWRDSLSAGGCSYRRAMVWVKPDGMPQYSGDRPGMGYESIVSAWAGKGKSKWNGGGRHGVFIVNKFCGAGPNLHPTQKPIDLMTQIVSLFDIGGGPVLDPFCGSGTTLVAAKLNGCKAIGIDQNERYCEIAAKRLAQGVLFGAESKLEITAPACAED